MRFVIATLAALLTILAGILLSGAGHGWNLGALGCFVLAPMVFLACSNALGPKPSQRVALTVLACGLATCLLVAVGTFLDGAHYFSRYFRINGVVGFAVAAFALLAWMLPSFLVLLRSPPKPRVDP